MSRAQRPADYAARRVKRCSNDCEYSTPSCCGRRARRCHRPFWTSCPTRRGGNWRRFVAAWHPMSLRARTMPPSTGWCASISSCRRSRSGRGMLAAGEVVAVAVEKPAAGGAMIARHDGRVILVVGAIPGERVRARIVRVAKAVAYAETVAVDEASPDRRDAAVDLLCGGSLYAHIAYPRQLALKAEVVADAFKRIGRMDLPAPVPVTPSPEDGYRMRARLHARGHR